MPVSMSQLAWSYDRNFCMTSDERAAYSSKPVHSAAGVKTANVLNKLPKHLQPKAKSNLHQIWMADTRENARLAFDLFVQT